ncbi:MAG: hypothetical protein ACRDSJ_05770 [Rubrobacteraceae bacterium]
MDAALRAIETTGTVDEQSRLHLDEPLPIAGSGRVKVIVLIPEGMDPDERAWLKSAASNPAFEFLKDEGEDIYGPGDGRPFVDQR